jgi:hypothetical protein
LLRLTAEEDVVTEKLLSARELKEEDDDELSGLAEADEDDKLLCTDEENELLSGDEDELLSADEVKLAEDVLPLFPPPPPHAASVTLTRRKIK